MSYVLTSLSGNLISAASAGYAPTNSAEVSAIASAYATGGVDSATVSAIASAYVESGVSSKQDTLTFGYNDSTISSINGSALAGGGGASYTSPSGTIIVGADTLEGTDSGVGVTYLTSFQKSGYFGTTYGPSASGSSNYPTVFNLSGSAGTLGCRVSSNGVYYTSVYVDELNGTVVIPSGSWRLQKTHYAPMYWTAENYYSGTANVQLAHKSDVAVTSLKRVIIYDYSTSPSTTSTAVSAINGEPIQAMSALSASRSEFALYSEDGKPLSAMVTATPYSKNGTIHITGLEVEGSDSAFMPSPYVESGAVTAVPDAWDSSVSAKHWSYQWSTDTSQKISRVDISGLNNYGSVSVRMGNYGGNEDLSTSFYVSPYVTAVYEIKAPFYVDYVYLNVSSQNSASSISSVTFTAYSQDSGTVVPLAHASALPTYEYDGTAITAIDGSAIGGGGGSDPFPYVIQSGTNQRAVLLTAFQDNNANRPTFMVSGYKSSNGKWPRMMVTDYNGSTGYTHSGVLLANAYETYIGTAIAGESGVKTFRMDEYSMDFLPFRVWNTSTQSWYTADLEKSYYHTARYSRYGVTLSALENSGENELFNQFLNSGIYMSSTDYAYLDTADTASGMSATASASAEININSINSWNGKLDTTAFNSSDFYTTANPSGFITGVDLSDYATTAYVDSSVSSFVDSAACSAIASAYAESAQVVSSVDSAASMITAATYVYQINGCNLLASEAYSAHDWIDASSKLDESATADFYSTSNPSGFIDSAYVDSAVSSKADSSSLSSYALSADVSGTVDLVSTQSANWGGSALALSAGPGVTLSKSGDTLTVSTETVLWSGTPVTVADATAGLTLAESPYNFDRVALYWVPWNYTVNSLEKQEAVAEARITSAIPRIGSVTEWNAEASNTMFIFVLNAYFDASKFYTQAIKYFSIGDWTVNVQGTGSYITKIVGINRTAEA